MVVMWVTKKAVIMVVPKVKMPKEMMISQLSPRLSTSPMVMVLPGSSRSEGGAASAPSTWRPSCSGEVLKKAANRIARTTTQPAIT